MNEFIATTDLKAVLAGRRTLPTITLWNRLEGRPRAHDFDRALRAEVRDPLWMLTKQWQMGEFEGDDAGSPVTAKVHVETSQMTKYRAASSPPETFNNDVPLEAKVEQRPVPLRRGGQPIALDIRLAMGRRWLKLVQGIEPGLAQKFIDAFPIAAPNPASAADAHIAAHREAWQAFAAMAGRAMDGGALYEHLTADVGNHAHDQIALANAGSDTAIEVAEAEFLEWFRTLFYQPAGNFGNAWLPERLEYAFAATAPDGEAEKHLIADGYHHGHLDAYNLDIEPSSQGLGDVVQPLL